MAPLVASKAVLQEVAGLIRLVRIGESSADEIRLLIGESRNAFRRAVRQTFDVVLNNGASVPAFESPRVRARRFSPQLKRRIEAAARAGRGPEEIARELGISSVTAAKACRKFGPPKPKKPPLKKLVDHRKPTSKRPSDEQLARATQLLKAGQSWEQVAREIGISRPTLQKYNPWRKVIRKSWTPEVIATVERALSDGRKVLEISRTYGLSSTQIYKTRKELEQERAH
jgi:transposase-like protein